MKQKITLAIEKQLLRQARALAVQHGISLNVMPADELEKIVTWDTRYGQARANALALLRSPFRLGGKGVLDRQALHERKSLG